MVVELIALGVSLVAATLSLHTKYEQRRKKKLKGLAMELQELRERVERIKVEINQPRVNEDTEIELENISKEVLTGKHETKSDELLIGVEVKNISTRETLEDINKALSSYQSGDIIYYEIMIGNLDQLYATNKKISMRGPIGNSMYVYEEMIQIEKEYGDILEEYDDSLLEDVRDLMDTMIDHTLYNIINNKENFEIEVSKFDTTDEIGTYVFETVFHYPEIEEDMEDLNEELDRIEEYRTSILQASY
jgi:hypothetical protein